MRYICFDIGDRRTGVAFGDDITGLASPDRVIQEPMNRGLIDQIVQLIDESGVDVVVIGLPLNMDGTIGPQAKKVQTVQDAIVNQVSVPVVAYDERLSSYQADQSMARSGLTHRQKKVRRDAIAAAVILRDYLESQNTNTTHNNPDEDDPVE